MSGNFKRRGYTILIPLDQVLLKYLPREKKTVLYTKKGKCEVCGKIHSSERSWRSCASKRAEIHPLVFGSKPIYVVPGWVGKFAGVKLEAEIKKPNPILTCVFPEEKVKEAEEEILRLIDRATERIAKDHDRYVREGVRDLMTILGLDPTIALREDSAGDVVGRMIIEILLSDDPPIMPKSDDGYWRFWEFKRDSTYLKMVGMDTYTAQEFEIYFEEFERWLARKTGISKLNEEWKTYTRPSYTILKITKDGKAIMRELYEWKDPYDNRKRTRRFYYLIDLRKLRIDKKLSPQAALRMIKRKEEVEELPS